MVNPYVSKVLDTSSPIEASSLQSNEGTNAIIRRKAKPSYKTIKDVAKDFSVSDKLVRKLAQSGEIPSIELAYRIIRIPESGPEKALKALTVVEADE